MNESSKIMEPLNELSYMSRERAGEVVEDAKAYNVARAFANAQALLEMASMENDTLKKLRLLARAQNAFEELSKKIERLKNDIDNAAINIGSRLIPNLMDAAGIEEFSLTGGTKVIIEQKIHAALGKRGNPVKAFEWMEANGQGALIKHTISVPFSTREGAEADKLKAVIEEAFPERIVEDKKDVHPSTLSAMVREALRDGKNLPMDIFGVHPERVAKIIER